MASMHAQNKVQNALKSAGYVVYCNFGSKQYREYRSGDPFEFIVGQKISIPLTTVSHEGIVYVRPDLSTEVVAKPLDELNDDNVCDFCRENGKLLKSVDTPNPIDITIYQKDFAFNRLKDKISCQVPFIGGVTGDQPMSN